MDFINVIGTFYDNSMEHVVALTKHIKDLRLDKTLEEINEDIYNKLGNSSENKGSKGFFNSFESLLELISNPEVGDWAVVLDNNKQVICICEELGIWILTENEYKLEINLENYAKKSEFKTINNLSILGEGDISISAEGALLATSEKDGLMSKESYSTLQEIRFVIIPQIEENIETLREFINDDTNIQDIINRYYQIKEFIESLENTKGEDILYSIITLLTFILSNLSSEILRALREEQEIKDRLRNLESSSPESSSSPLIQELLERIQILENNSSSIKHKFLNQQQYDSLNSYEKNTLYFIVDSLNSFCSVFGDTFPFTLGGNDSNTSSCFGDVFPLIFGDNNYYIGGKFPIKFK